MKLKYLMCIAVFLVGCMKAKRGQSDWAQETQYYQNDTFDDAAEVMPPMQGAYAKSRSGSSRSMKPSKTAEISEKAFIKSDDNNNQDNERMMHYNGSANLLVSRVSETLDALEKLAIEHGGGLVARGSNHIMLQVPRENFDVAYSAALELGDVLDKNISTTDVTEAYTDTALRLEAMKTTRDRLIELLAKTSDEGEKVKILQQVQRLSEQIDSKEAQLRGLKNLADFSNITIHLELRQAGRGYQEINEIVGFGWINRLSPFEGFQLHNWKDMKLESPKGMVLLNPKGPYHAESPDKANVFAGKIPNSPSGNSEFWRNAIIERIAGEYDEVTSFEKGDFLGLRLQSDTEDPYIWYLYIRADKKWLDVIQIYYPTKDHETRLNEQVVVILEEGQ